MGLVLRDHDDRLCVGKSPIDSSGAEKSLADDLSMSSRLMGRLRALLIGVVMLIGLGLALVRVCADGEAMAGSY